MKNMLKGLALVAMVVLLLCNGMLVAVAEETKGIDSPSVGGATIGNITCTTDKEAETFEFTGRVSIALRNQGDIYFGDTVILDAWVVDANADYTVIWEYYNEAEQVWVAIAEGESYSFVVDEVNANYAYRAVLVVAE